jgi:hypothetical protein
MRPRRSATKTLAFGRALLRGGRVTGCVAAVKFMPCRASGA